ncbi:hypothetical protein NX059_008192 [Plenodomus lindquistii]|nr:hypothetical protein NX059_008192 [Plenodomus lindquistii]
MTVAIRDTWVLSSPHATIQSVLRDVREHSELVDLGYAATLGQGIAARFIINGRMRRDEEEIQERALRAYLKHDLKKDAFPSVLFRYDDVPSDHVLAGFFSDRIRYADGKKFFWTRQGMLGVGPAIVAKGDVLVALFSKESRLFILRPVGDLWRFVGTCYVHKLRDGKFLDRWKESGEPAEDFIIY